MDRKAELEIVIPPHVKEAMDNDPRLGEVMRSFCAAARQAQEGVNTGKYKDFNAGIEAVTGHKPVAILETDGVDFFGIEAKPPRRKS